MRTKNKVYLLFGLLLIFAFSLFACSSEEHTKDLHQYMATLKKVLIKYQRKDIISSIKFPKPAVFQSVGKQRDPFVEEEAAYNGKAMMNPLIAFPVKLFVFMGIIAQGNQIWAIIRAPDNKVYQLTVKDRIGDHYGRIVVIQPDHIEIEEKASGQPVSPGQAVGNQIVTLQLKGGS